MSSHGEGGTEGADDQGVLLAGYAAPEHAHDLPAAVAGAVRLAANARVRGPQRVRTWAITHSALLAAQPPPRSTRRLNRPRPARRASLWPADESFLIKTGVAPGLDVLRAHETDRTAPGK
jgi:hypothetical protein